MVVLNGESIKDYIKDYVKINQAGIDVKPTKIYRIPIKKIKYALIDDNNRSFFFDLDIGSYEDLFTINIDEKRRNELLKNSIKKIPEAFTEIKPKKDYWEINKGYYYAVFPEIKIPNDCVALALPRSTFNRFGILKYESALFDPGYIGEFSQTYFFPIKAKISIKDAWIQVIFIKLDKETKEGYRGYWYNEKY
ncbi:deoxycytidine triphosphate deaminase [Nanobdella aerobiophila]|uniref:Deoxycytidine triphosphate deaminase n=1 Tax=Nanobdella aerobiophila TaxID=2586965 RepID=A0A915SKD0_9ARCH|nr:deoxycytidine deaminase [Nanobdella aerobiophila]BBL45563.1 deoxycytidine triphosphate deaminase [Nanobdella aerobiophila]